MIFLEVFAGSGNLSEAVRSLGLTVHAVDSVTKHQTGVAIHVLDLTKPSELGILFDIALRANVASAHFAPPWVRLQRLVNDLFHQKCKMLNQNP